MNGLSICSSYARLGLIHDLNPSAPGGSEQVLVPRNGEEMALDQPEQVAEPSSSSKRLPAGHGRIIRDVSGNVIGVELPEEDEEAGDEVEETMDDLEPEADGSVMGRWAASLGQHNEVAGEKPTGLLEGEFASISFHAWRERRV
jgi:nucleolar protein 16